MNQRVVVALVGFLVVAVLVGVAAVLISGDSDDATDGRATEEECAEAAALVENAQRNVSELTSSNEIQRDAEFYALLVSEQRAVTYVMEEVPECFTLTDRAGATGLLEAFTGLLAIAEPPPQVIEPDPAVPQGGSDE